MALGVYYDANEISKCFLLKDAYKRFNTLFEYQLNTRTFDEYKKYPDFSLHSRICYL